jgi:hypothetical protein
MSVIWRVVHLAKVSCCGRTYALAFDTVGNESMEFFRDHISKYVNVTYEAHTEPGAHTGGRYMCGGCPRVWVNGKTVFPESCARVEAR